MSLDTDFQRLLQGKVKLADLSAEEQKELKVKLQNLDSLDNIKDSTTREMLKRWAAYFPE